MAIAKATRGANAYPTGFTVDIQSLIAVRMERRLA